MLRFLEALIIQALKGISVAKTTIGGKVSQDLGLL